MRSVLWAVILALNSYGCALVQPRPIVLYPIEKSDIFDIPVGTQIGSVKTEKPGWFISDLFMSEVMNAKLKSK